MNCKPCRHPDCDSLEGCLTVSVSNENTIAVKEITAVRGAGRNPEILQQITSEQIEFLPSSLGRKFAYHYDVDGVVM